MSLVKCKEKLINFLKVDDDLRLKNKFFKLMFEGMFTKFRKTDVVYLANTGHKFLKGENLK